MIDMPPLPAEAKPAEPESETEAKADPETLALRSSPAHVTRFHRGKIIAIAALVSIAIGGVTWLAFKSKIVNVAGSAGKPIQLSEKASDEVLNGVPKSYGDVPPLGSALPGDLGKPILDHQREIVSGTPSGPAARAAQAVETERQRIASEKRAARESAVLLPMTSGSARAVPPVAASIEAVPGSSTLPPGSAATSNDQLRKNTSADRINASDAVNPHQLSAPLSPWTLQAGSIIAASLITGLNSDLPGLVTAQVTENIYDSVTGRTLLIPQGSRLIGSYDSVVAFGQSRALVVWQRLILPDGSSLQIENVPTTDTQGYAGLSDRIDRHTWQILKGVVLSSLLGVGTELGRDSNEGDLIRAIRDSTQQGGARAGDQLVARNLDVQPTLRVRPGWPLRIIVHKDMVLKPWRERRH